MKLNFQVNGRAVELDVSPKKRLLDILREDLDLISTKEGCGKGECGACTVLLDGKRVNSCLVPALQVEGSRIFTLEGLQIQPFFKMIEQAYIEHGAVQCGFCMSGFVVSTVGLLKEENPPFRRDDILWKMGGNICRCTGYTKIIDAVESLVAQPELVRQIQNEWDENDER